jgi:uncharacterized protein (TIGR03067 family)
MRISAVITALVCAASVVNAQDAEVVNKIELELTLKRLQGAWVPDMLVTSNGAEKYPLSGRGLVFNGATFARTEGKHTVATGTFKIEGGYLRLAVDSRAPWDLESSDNRAKIQYAFKVDADLLTVCYSTDDKGKPNDLTPGAGRHVVVYKRQTTDAKAPVRGR